LAEETARQEKFNKRNRAPKMTQIYRIDTAGENRLDAQQFSDVINEWGALTTRFNTLYQYDNISNEEQIQYSAQTQGVSGFAYVYRKNGRNFLWRGTMVPSRIRMRLIDAYLKEEIEGTLILYKAGSSATRTNKEKYPIRLTGSRYAFVTGDTRFMRVFGRHSELMIYDSDTERHQRAEMVYDLWGSENLLDYSVGTESFKRRAFYVLMLSEHMSLAEYEDYFNEYAEVRRSAYCIWKDGEIIEWRRMGDNYHPSI